MQEKSPVIYPELFYSKRKISATLQFSSGTAEKIALYLPIIISMRETEGNRIDMYSPEVGPMFDSIAGNYDFLNHFLSFGIDRLWRRRAIKTMRGRYSDPLILDVATGTADLALSALRLKPRKITGIDISENMLALGRKKVEDKGVSSVIELFRCESEKITLDDGIFDIAMVAFGVRNFRDPLKGLKEMNRVLKPGGSVLILEFSKPSWFPFKQLYYLYFLHVLPFIGRLFSGSNNAYRYLPESVLGFPDNEKFIKILSSAGFGQVSQIRLTGGVASIYTGIKPGAQ